MEHSRISAAVLHVALHTVPYSQHSHDKHHILQSHTVISCFWVSLSLCTVMQSTITILPGRICQTGCLEIEADNIHIEPNLKLQPGKILMLMKSHDQPKSQSRYAMEKSIPTFFFVKCWRFVIQAHIKLWCVCNLVSEWETSCKYNTRFAVSSFSKRSAQRSVRVIKHFSKIQFVSMYSSVQKSTVSFQPILLMTSSVLEEQNGDAVTSSHYKIFMSLWHLFLCRVDCVCSVCCVQFSDEDFWV